MTAVSDLKTFASLKFDLINAIVCDPRLRPSTTRVATALLSFANSKTWLIYPSQERVALMVDLKTRMVRSAIAQLVATNWLRIERTSRRQTNKYCFVHTNIPIIRERVQRIADEFAAMRGNYSPVTGDGDGQGIAAPDKQHIAGLTGREMPPNTISYPLQVTTQRSRRDKKAAELSTGQSEHQHADEEGLAQLATRTAKQASPSRTAQSADDSFRPVGAYIEPNFDRLLVAAKLRAG